jgi:hypothetical protein
MKNLEDLLVNTDFSQNSKNKEAIKTELLKKLECEGQKKYSGGKMAMKKNRYKPYAVAAAAIVTVGVLMAACGEEIVKNFQQFTVGRYASFIAAGDSANGRFSNNESHVFLFDYASEIDREKGLVTYFDTISDVKPYLAFSLHMPAFVPTGFAIDRISLYNDENGQPLPLGSNMYLNVFYTDEEKTQQIYMQVRQMDEETAFVSSGSNDMQYISVNGQVGVVDGKNVYLEIGGVMYMIMAGMAYGVTQDDVANMAKSLK